MDAPRPLVLLSSLAAGGAERVTVSFARRLAERGYHVELCTLTDRHDSALVDELRHRRIVRHDLGARRLLDPGAARRYLALMGTGRFDVVHAHGQDAWILAGLARRLTDVPLVLTRHVLDEPARNWRQSLRRRWALDAARRADVLLAPSAATARRLAELAGVRPSSIQVLPNGIDLDRFTAPDLERRRAARRAAFGWADDERVALVPAVLRAGKGHDVLLAALPRLCATVPGARLVLAGGGELEPALREAARPHGDRVRMLGHRDDMAELQSACDLVVLPSLAEALPVALIEGAAAGRAIVATRVGGVADIVEHGVTGLLVPPGDPGALAEAVGTLLTDSAKAASFGRAGRSLVSRRFSLDAFVDRTVAVWSRVTGQRRAAA